MRVLLLTDTHGQLDKINQFADRYHADACIHCGDIGLIDSVSIRSMPARELAKMIRHDPYLTEDEKVRYSSLPQAELAELILQQGIAGSFEEYLTGKKRFAVGRRRDRRKIHRVFDAEHTLRPIACLDHDVG